MKRIALLLQVSSSFLDGHHQIMHHTLVPSMYARNSLSECYLLREDMTVIRPASLVIRVRGHHMTGFPLSGVHQ